VTSLSLLGISHHVWPQIPLPDFILTPVDLALPRQLLHVSTRVHCDQGFGGKGGEEELGAGATREGRGGNPPFLPD
jgi:hypothetical protein